MPLPTGEASSVDDASSAVDTDIPDPTVRERHPSRQIAVILFAATAVLVVGLFAASRDTAAEPWAGTVLPAPQEKPDITLTDTSGEPFDLRAETDGRATIMMFGYTSCPDICPINLGTLDAAMEDLGPSTRDAIDVVFVTVDPDTDTPQVLREYLDRFDTRFVGLTGSPEQLRAAQLAADVPPATRGSGSSTGSSGEIGHATQMIFYDAAGVARIVYPFGARQADWTRDLPRLLAGEIPTP